MSVEEAGFRFLLVSVKILINWFLRGIQIQKDGVRSKPQIFRGLDGWYASNIITIWRINAFLAEEMLLLIRFKKVENK